MYTPSISPNGRKRLSKFSLVQKNDKFPTKTLHRTSMEDEVVGIMLKIVWVRNATFSTEHTMTGAFTLDSYPTKITVAIVYSLQQLQVVINFTKFGDGIHEFNSAVHSLNQHLVQRKGGVAPQ